MSDENVPGLLHPTRSALLIVDVQRRFASAIPEFDRLVENCARLARTFRALDLPIVATEQYPEGLGSTVPTLLRELDARDLPSKTSFSALGCDDARVHLVSAGADTIVVCGIETHVCVLQTVLELIAANRTVHIPADAVASRHALDRDVALRRLERAGAVITTSETVAFELMRDAKHPQFKAIQTFYR